MRKVVEPKGTAQPKGHYSVGIEAKGRFVFVSGQGPIVPETGEVLEGDVANETRRTLENVRLILEAAGANLSDVVKVNVYLRNIEDFETMNGVYKTFFPCEPPARTTIGCQMRISVEIDCIAVLPED